MKITSLIIVCVSFLALSAPSTAQQCNPAPKNVASLKEIRPQSFTVEGPLAEFDPCHTSVKLQRPLFSNKPPLMIIVHGGGGVDLATRNAADAFRNKGFASLFFDSYEHNGFNQGFSFWGSRATNEARQRMIYKVTLSAYEWALKRDDINTNQIYFYGVSNGGAVLANIAGAVSQTHVKGVFAEGTPGAGLGLPDQLNVPLRMIYGKLDNYGGRSEDEMIWLRQDPCFTNTASFIHPKGNALTCNGLVNSGGRAAKPIDWYEEQKKKGADVEVWFYDNAAHGIFLGPIQKNMITYGADLRRFAWVGADASARSKRLDDIMQHYTARK